MRGLDRGSGHVPVARACTRCTSSGWTGYGRRKISMPLQGPLSLRIRIPPDVVSPPIHRGPSRDVPGAGGRCVEHDCHLKGWGSQRVLCPKVPIQATVVPRCQDRLILPSSNVFGRLGSHASVGLGSGAKGFAHGWSSPTDVTVRWLSSVKCPSPPTHLCCDQLVAS